MSDLWCSPVLHPAFYEGRRAYLDCENVIRDCPYDTCDRQWEPWQRGYIDAQDEADKRAGLKRLG